MKKILLALVLCLFAGTVSAQTINGTLSWTHTRPADLAKYTLVVDGGAPSDLGLPPANNVTLPLAVGSHNIVLNACYTDTTCVPSNTLTLLVSTGGPLTYSNLSPVNGFSSKNGVPIVMSVTTTDNSGILSVTGYWSLFGGGFSARTPKKVGDTYSWTETPTSGAGARAWYFTIKANDGEIVVTPTRSITITP